MIQLTPDGGEDDVFPSMPDKAFHYVVVYSRVVEVEVERFALDMHQSMGGQCSVFCNSCDCSEQPLIMSGMVEQKRRDCMSKKCKKRESYMCSRAKCILKSAGVVSKDSDHNLVGNV